MAFTVTEIIRTPPILGGNRRIVLLKAVTTGADTGGEVPTGLHCVDYAFVVQKGTAVAEKGGVFNETFPLASGNVTYAGNATETVYILAIGE